MVPVGSPLWAEYLKPTRHDVYDSAPYHGFMQEQGHGEPWLAIAGSPEKFVAWPLLLRSLDHTPVPYRDGLRDITSVYGYAGPLAYGCAQGDPFLFAAWNFLVAHWRAMNVVSVFCRFHPLLENHCWLEGSAEYGRDGTAPSLERTLEGHTVSLDLTLTDEQAWAGYRDTHRRHMNRARRAGLVCEVDYSFTHLADFVRLYHATMQRHSASAEYFHSADSFERLRRRLSPAIFLHVAHAGPQVAAAALVSEYQGIVQYLYGGVEEQFLEISPLKLLLESVRKWSRSRGNRILHLGGGVGGHEDSLFYFKSGFSHSRHAFYTGRRVLEPDLYRCLCEGHQRAAEELGKTVDPHFFPAYRAPFIEISGGQKSVSLATA